MPEDSYMTLQRPFRTPSSLPAPSGWMICPLHALAGASVNEAMPVIKVLAIALRRWASVMGVLRS